MALSAEAHYRAVVLGAQVPLQFFSWEARMMGSDMTS